MTGAQPKFLFFFFFASLVLSGCGLLGGEKKVDTTGNIFGQWELQEIRYENGEVLKPADGEPYWFELSQDSIWAEGAYHPSLVGQSNCNPCFGYFDYNEKDQSINISFICERLVCGIASTFSLTVATSNRYSFKEGKLLLFFDSIPHYMSAGKIILKPKQ